MGIKNAKSQSRKYPSKPKPTSSSSKSSRSNSVQKSDLSCDNIQAVAELDANSIHPQSGILEGETGERILEETRTPSGARGIDLPEPTELTAITLQQPWASLIAQGKKHYETRDWSTDYRGQIAIHAGKKFHNDKSLISLLEIPAAEVPLGAVVAIAQLTDCILMDEEFILKQSSFEQYLGLWEVGRYAWKLENVRAIEPISATGKQGLWKWEHRQDWQKKFFGINDGIKYLDESDSWNPADFGELHHVPEANGQLNLLNWSDKEPPEPSDYSSIELFDEAYKQWVDAQTDEAEEELANFGVEELKSNQFKAWLQTEEGKAKTAKFGVTIEPPDPNDYEFPEQFEEDYKNWVAAQPDENLANFKEVETWNQLMDGSICVQESGPASPTQELNCGDEAPTSSANGTTTASDFSKSDSLEQSNLPISNSLTSSAKSPSPIDQESSQLPPPANLSATTGTDLEQMTTETASVTYFEQSETCNPTSQLSKTLPDSSLALTPPATEPEPTSDLSSTPYPRAGTMQNGLLSAAPTLPPPGVESESLLLRSPGGLSSGEGTRPPGKSKLETQLNQSGLIQDGEVVAPEFLELGYNLPVGWTNLQEKRTAIKLAQVQAQQSLIDPKSELPAETATTETDEKHSGTHLTGELPVSDSSELNISVTLPPNIGALSKAELIGMASEQHQLICGIERKKFKLAFEKLYRIHVTGLFLMEFKKRCQYGEFVEQLEAHGINPRVAQNYMMVSKNWEIVETKAHQSALLSENNESPNLGINWALQIIREEKKQLKQQAPPKSSDDWRTPNTTDQPVVKLVRKALGGDIWLDPCSDSGSSIPASVRYWKNTDGLAQHNTWSKTVFINPPFSDPLPWVERCCFEIARGNVSAAVMLLKSGTISNLKTGELINKYASAICHWRGRINFLNDEGNAVKGSDFDCVFVYFGARFDLFRQAFGGRGTIAMIENHYSSVNKKFMTKGEKAEFGNVEAEQKHLAAAVGLGNGRSVLPDMRDADRERNERYDPHTVMDVLFSSMPTASSKPVPVSENLAQPIGEAETFDETPLATRQFQKAKENTLNDYITAISSNLSEFSDEQIAFLAKIINEESAKRIGF